MSRKKRDFENDSKKLAASLKKVQKVFDKCYEKGISPKGKRWSESTRDTYFEMMAAFVREYNSTFGVSDITKMTDEDKVNQLIQNRIDRYHAGELSQAYSLKTLRAAITAFNHGTANTNVFKEELKMGDSDRITAMLKENNVTRKTRASKTLRANTDQSESVLANIKNQGYDTEKRKLAYHVGRIGLETGGRISSILRLRAQDVVIDKRKNQIRFIDDKGGLSRTVDISSETARYLAELKGQKEGTDRLFVSKRKDGTFLSVAETRKELSKIYSAAGSHLVQTSKVQTKTKDGKKKTVEVTQKFSSHSFRKAFAMERTKKYFDIISKSKSQRDKFISMRIGDDKKLKEKLDTVRRRINKDRGEKRDLTDSELAIFFTSVDLGHFRNDVITGFYTTFKEVETYYNKEK